MDSGWPRPPIGYHRWHAFIRATELMDLGSKDRWIQIDRYVGLAWVIQCKQIPKDSDVLDSLGVTWLQKSFEDLDKAFGLYEVNDSVTIK
jgi:hypothetical protein